MGLSGYKRQLRQIAAMRVVFNFNELVPDRQTGVVRVLGCTCRACAASGVDMRVGVFISDCPIWLSTSLWASISSLTCLRLRSAIVARLDVGNRQWPTQKQQQLP